MAAEEKHNVETITDLPPDHYSLLDIESNKNFPYNLHDNGIIPTTKNILKLEYTPYKGGISCIHGYSTSSECVAPWDVYCLK